MPTVQSSGGDYTTLALAEAGENDGNDYSVSGPINIECYASAANDGQCIVDGGTNQDATNKLTITSPDGEYHAGSYRSGYYIAVTGSVSPLIIRDPYVVVEKLDVYLNNTGTGFINGIDIDAVDNVTIDRCLVETNAGANFSGIKVTGNNCAIHRSIIITRNTNNNAINFDTATSTDTLQVYRCNLYTNGTVDNGIRNKGVLDVRNTAVAGFTADFTLVASGTYGGSADNCATTESTTPFGSSNQHSMVAADEWTDPSTSDFSLKSGGTKLAGNGQDLTSTLPTDIIGNAYSAANDDIGAYAATGITLTAAIEGAGAEVVGLAYIGEAITAYGVIEGGGAEVSGSVDSGVPVGSIGGFIVNIGRMM